MVLLGHTIVKLKEHHLENKFKICLSQTNDEMRQVYASTLPTLGVWVPPWNPKGFWGGLQSDPQASAAFGSAQPFP